MTKTCGSRVLALLLGVAAMFFALPSDAAQYEIFIDIEDEDDLFDLNRNGQIEDDTFEQLIDLLRQGVDLNLATREQLYSLPNLTYEDVDKILLYRTEAGRINDPADLVVAEALSRRKLESIAPFLIVPKRQDKLAAFRGYVRYQTIVTALDNRAPPMALQGRFQTARYLHFGGAAVLDRNRVAAPRWDPNRDALTTTGQRTLVRAPKYYIGWNAPKWQVIAGTYTIGFGQRLVLDNTNRYTPNGIYPDYVVNRRTALSRRCRESTGELDESPCPFDEPREYVTPDFRVPQRFRGAAFGVKKIELPKGWLQAYGFFSHQTREIYQYQLYNRDVCDDPRRNSEDFPECGSVDVFLQRDDPLERTSEVSFSTLPNMYNEIAGGGNFSYFFDRRTHVGVTGYGADNTWLIDGADLDLQEWARSPYGGPFGAVGGDAAFGRKWADIFLEVGHSFDSMDSEGGGGPAALLRHTATWDTHEIEASVRYYDEKYANPYARPIAAPDQFEGLRARDEAGGRIRYSGLIVDMVTLRTFFDVWGNPSDGRPQLRTYARADVQATKWLRPGLWLEYQSRDLRTSGRDRCYGTQFNSGDDTIDVFTSTEDNPDDTEALCAGGLGERVRLRPRVRFDPHKRVNFQLEYQHDLVDDQNYDDSFRQDIAGILTLGANPIEDLRLRARFRYDFDDIQDNTRLAQTIWTYLRVAYRIRRWFVPSIRYDVRVWLDDRDSTDLRRPVREHWVIFQLESRF